MDFSALKRNRSSLESLSKAIEQTANPQEGGSKDDTRFWQPSVDKSGNGMATIRFLPAPAADGDDALPWVRVFSHGFQGPGGWFIDNCLTTLNEKCPVCEHNNTLWNSGIEANKDIVRKQKRKLNYIANIYVVSDPSNPQNEGKVFLFKFGKKIFDKIMDKARPTFEDEKPVNVFDFWEGANFKLRMRKKDGYANYDESAFMEPSAISDDEDRILSIANSQHKLAEFLDRKNFKSYDELKKKLNDVLSGDSYVGKSAAQMAEDDDEPASAPAPTIKSKPAPAPKASSNDDDDVMSYFQKIAQED